MKTIRTRTLLWDSERGEFFPLDVWGTEPNPWSCAKCERELTKETSKDEGGNLCDACATCVN